MNPEEIFLSSSKMKRRLPSISPTMEEAYSKRPPQPSLTACQSFYRSPYRHIRTNLDVKRLNMIPFFLPASEAQEMGLRNMPRNENGDVIYTERLLELYWKVYAKTH